MKPLIKIIFALVVLTTTSWANHKTYFEFEEDHSLPIVYLNFVLDYGSAHDPANKLGLANVAAKMMLRGTQKKTKSQFYDTLNKIGGQIEVEVKSEGTIFKAAVLAENLTEFVSLLEETFVNPKFTAEELRKLKKEVESEILEQKGNDRNQIQLHFAQFFYQNHPYSHPHLGKAKTLNNIQPTDVVRYFNETFSSKNIHFFGSGAVNKNVLETWFSNLVEKLDALHPESVGASAIPPVNFTTQRRALIVDKPKSTQTQILLGGPGNRPEAHSFYAIQLANHSFGGGSFQARMMQELRVKRGWTYGASNGFKFGRQNRHFAMFFFPKTDDAVPAVELSYNLFNDFIQHGISQREYHFAKASLVNNSPFNYDTSKKRIENSVNEYILQFPKNYFKDLENNLKKVSFEEIQPALAQNFNNNSLVLVILGDAKKIKPKLEKLNLFEKIEVKNFLED